MTKSRKTSRSRASSRTSDNVWDIQDKALKEFERGVNLLHKRNYSDALVRFQLIMDQYPDEKELTDRTRCYIRICRSMLDSKGSQPKKPEEFFYHGVMKANEADFDAAVGFLDRALQASPKDEKIYYVLASTLALKGDSGEAVKHLQKAIDLNATNRIFARNDPDFEQLRDNETFQNLIYPEEM
ncbi:MAG: tetratricopeptide repeat protein [Acidobacteria bacterium]|nr:tetratricopeptide repeat protein [Acidobacteriota bacterium]